MSDEQAASTPPGDDFQQTAQQWFISRRWRAYEGEQLANLLRLYGIVIFYIHHLLNYMGFSLGPLHWTPVPDLSPDFHLQVTALFVAWLALSLLIHLLLGYQLFPMWLMFFSTAADVFFLSGLLTAADGLQSPLVVAYFPILILAGLRFRRDLVWFATSACVTGYLVVSGYSQFLSGTRINQMVVPIYYQVIFLLSLMLAGLMLDRVLHQGEMLAGDLASRLVEKQGPAQAEKTDE